jgi:FAD:protein FMN transferase
VTPGHPAGERALSFGAMGTTVEVVVAVHPRADRRERRPGPDSGGVDRTLRVVEALFSRLERRLSRFLPDSELSALNRAAGRGECESLRVSRTLAAVLGEALRQADATDGAFDPTVLPALVAAGYDRTFELLAAGGGDRGAAGENPDAAGGAPRGGPRRCSWRDVLLRRDAPGALVSLPAGCALDLGGIGKGWAVDRAADRLRRAGFTDFAVNAGGDLYAAGEMADGTPWTVGVEDPREEPRVLLVLAVRNGAVATSTTARRRWRHAGREAHHLIDPRTARPAESGVIAATVAARTTARAEALAKAAVIQGTHHGLHLLRKAGDAEGVLVLSDGRVLMTERLRRAAVLA